MTIDEFAIITRRIIARDGLDGFVPTLCLPDRRDVRVLVGIPADADVETESMKWAEQIADDGEEFLLALRVSDCEFRITRISTDGVESETFTHAAR